jgi:membrane protein DedA with SNARE-associated domain
MSVVFHAEIAHLMSTYGYWVIGGIVGLESLGIPAPGETTLIAAAIYAATTHHLDIRLVIAAAAVGAILGDNIGFWIGREVGYRVLLRYGRYVRLTERRIRLGQYLFIRHGGKVVFLGRFFAVLRAVAAFLAGANLMSWRRFLLFNAAGGVVWASIYGIGAYYLGHEAAHLAKPLEIAMGLVAATVIIIVLILLHRHEAQLQERAEGYFALSTATPRVMSEARSPRESPPRAATRRPAPADRDDL